MRGPFVFLRFASTLAARRTRRRLPGCSLPAIEAVEQRCLLSATGLGLDVVRDASGNPIENSRILPHQIFPPIIAVPGVSVADNNSSGKMAAETTPAEILKDVFAAVESSMGREFVDNAELSTGRSVASPPAVAPRITINEPPPAVAIVSSAAHLSLPATIYVRPTVDSSFARVLTSLLKGPEETGSSLRGKLVESQFRSKSTESNEQKSQGSTSTTRAFNWTNNTDGVDPLPTTAAATTSAVATFSVADQVREPAVVEQDQPVFHLAAVAADQSASELSLATTFNLDEDPSQSFFFDTDTSVWSLPLPSDVAGTTESMQLVLTSYFSNQWSTGKHDAAAAKPVATPQQLSRESDLLLSGKQGRKALSELPGDDTERVFLRESFKYLLSPDREAHDERLEETNPGIPGSNGHVDPGAMPKGNGTEPTAPPSDNGDSHRNESSMTWAGLLMAAAHGFRSLRNRRKLRSDSA